MTRAQSPGLLLGLSRNLASLASEPRIFARHPRLIVPDGGAVSIDPAAGRWIVEGEIALIIGREVRRASEAEAADAIAGWTIADDVTAIDLVAPDGYSQEAKGSATAMRQGMFPGAPPSDARIEVSIDGAQVAGGSMKLLRLQGAGLVAWVSRTQSLQPGDIILCGAPETAAPVEPGAEVCVNVPGFGALTHRIIT